MVRATFLEVYLQLFYAIVVLTETIKIYTKKYIKYKYIWEPVFQQLIAGLMKWLRASV